ncbi:MAG: TrmH family RNA methyltransferase, partial [Spirochaetaceae bacterium]|nr:TrmH family RNA methyltransferase [Spirochaetaceae bacterium]
MRILTGFHAIHELLRSSGGGPFRGRLMVSGSGPRVKEILELAARKGVRAERLRPEELDRLAPGNRGAALEAPEDEGGPETDLDGFLATVPERALVLVLDHIEDPQNLGAVLRSADAFAVDLVVAPRRRAAPLSDAAARASAGASAYVPFALVPNLAESLRRLATAGFWSYAADMDGSPLTEADLPAR